jgi:hypothetical protein
MSAKRVIQNGRTSSGNSIKEETHDERETEYLYIFKECKGWALLSLITIMAAYVMRKIYENDNSKGTDSQQGRKSE